MVESIPHTRGGQPKQPLPSPIQHQLNRINSDLQALGIQPAPLPDLRSSESLATYIITTQSKLNEETRDRGGKVGVVAAASIQEATSAAYKGKPDQLRQTLDQTEFVACQLNMQSKLSEPVCYLLGKLEISTLSANTTLDDALVLLKHCGLKHEDIPALMTEGQAGQLDALRLASLRLEHHRICLENCVQLFDLSGSSDGYQFAQQLLSMCGDRQRNPSEEVTRLSHAKSNRDFYIESVKDRLGEPLRIKDAQGHIREEFEPRIIISAEVNSPAPSGGFKVCRRVVDYSKITGGASLASKDPQNDPIDVHEALLQDTLYRVGIPNIPQVYSYAEDHITMEQCGETVFEFIQSNPEYGHRCDLIDIAFVTKEMLRTLNAMHNATITSVALWQLYPSGFQEELTNLKKRNEVQRRKRTLRPEQVQPASLDSPEQKPVTACFIHRDIKPQNIMLNRNKERKPTSLRLIDFGLTIEMSCCPNEVAGGSPAYAAPEMLYHKDPGSPKADIYALGCTLFEMRTGHQYNPFKRNFQALADSLSDAQRAADKGTLGSLYMDRAELDEDDWDPLDDLILSMLNPDPNKRPTAAEAIAAYGKIQWIKDIGA